MLTFGEIRERYEAITGEKITTVELASRIDKAQIEIAKKHGERLSYWYPRPVTETSAPIDDQVQTIPVVSTADILDPPGTIYLGTGSDVERMTYNLVAGNQLQQVQRSVPGRNWPQGTPVRMALQPRTEADLPADYLISHEVMSLGNWPYKGYQISKEMKILFFLEGLYKLIYTPVPEAIDHQDNASVPTVHRAFHEDIVTFCLAKHWEKIADGIPGEEEKAFRLMRSFQRSVEDTAHLLRRNVNERHQIDYELWS